MKIKHVATTILFALLLVNSLKAEYISYFVKNEVSATGEILRLSEVRVIQGEELKVASSENGEFYLTGWSKPEIDLSDLNRIAETKYGMKKEAIAGKTVSFNTESLHPGVYNISIVSNDVILETKEIVIAYPDDYTFDLKDSNLFGVKNIWNSSDEALQYNKYYGVVAVAGDDEWHTIQPKEDVFDFSLLDEYLEYASYTQKPILYKINTPAPEWVFDYVSHVGGKTEKGGVSRRSKAAQFWAPAYKKIYKQLIKALADHVKESPNRKWFLGVRIQPNAFNTEAFKYDFNGKEMKMAGIIPDRSTWIPPRNPKYEIYPGELEANDMHEAKQYFSEIISCFQDAFHPLGIYTFLRPNHAKDMAYKDAYQNEYTVAFITNCNAGRQRSVWIGSQSFKEQARDAKKGSFVEDQYASFLADDWNTRHGKVTNYDLVPRSAEMEIYWRQFYKLYMGATMSAFGAKELYRLDNPAYQAAVDIALKYAGGEMEVKNTVYAWMVFAEYTNRSLEPQMRNVGYWLSEDDSSKTKVVSNVTEEYRAFMLANILDNETALTLSPEFVKSRKGKAMISIEWFSETADSWALYADDQKLGVATGTGTGFIIDSFKVEKCPEHLIIRKISGNPKFHIVEVQAKAFRPGANQF